METCIRFKYFFSAVLLALSASAASAQATAPPRAKLQLVRELGPQWWRWRVALPGMALPDKDAAGHFCDVGQSGKTWFLAGLLSYGGPTKPVRRTCIVPAGRRLFFPVVTLSRIPHDSLTCGMAQTQVSSGIDRAEKLNATLDGADLLAGGVARWGSDGTCFRLNLPADGPSSSLTAAVDGYWLLLDPLPKGHHTLVYGATLPAKQGDAGRLQTTTYDLEVE